MESDHDTYSDDMPIDSDTDDCNDDSDDNLVNLEEQKNYRVLKEEDIRRCQDEEIVRVSAVLSVSRESACLLLRNYNWSVSNLHEAWFADEDRVRDAVGLLKQLIIQFPHDTQLTCGICFDTFPLYAIHESSCGHIYCNTCWRSYISISINDGPGCLMLRCPDPSCNAAVTRDLIDKLVCDEDREKYDKYIIRSYIECNRKTKWCPAPGCDCAVEYVFGSGSYDVLCFCSYSFCWNCTEEAHRPVDCDTVAKWMLKNSTESENVNWITANTKPCPKCKLPIEKNQGCMRITCRAPCKFEFCWLCLSEWSVHGYAKCNRYEILKKDEEFNEAEKSRELAKKYIQKYTHYYERWASNHKSRLKSLADLNEMETEHLEKLAEKQAQPVTQLSFITEAWLQIVECRRVLKWTYAYGYYLPEHEEARRQLFEYLQGEAETALERLHHCAEKELETYIKEPSDDFNNFRIKLTGLTTVTKNFFENLVRALETGLSDVQSTGVDSKSKKRKGSISSSSSSTNSDEC